MIKNTFLKVIKQNPSLFVILWLVCVYSVNINATETAVPEIHEEDLTDYILGPGDKLEISVFRNSDLTSSPQVDTTGMLTLPLLNDMKVVGLTPYQLRDKITEGLKKYIKDPQVTVMVSSYQSKKITVIGEVNNPGVFKIEKPQPVSLLISNAGGFTENANKEGITIIRKDSKGANQLIMVDMVKLLREGDTKQNIILQKDDIIYVPKDERKVTVLGEINTPGTIGISVRLGILEAIAKAGNFTTDANKNNIIIMGKDNKSPIRIVDYQQILDNRDLSKNLTLTDGEVVYVPRENKQVLIIGEVTNPGVISNDPQQTLLEAITKRGGFTTDGNKSKVFIIRGTTEKANIVSYNLKKLLKEGDVSQNILLQKGDIVYVPPTFIASTESVLNHIRSILSVALSAESAITFWPQTKQVLETGESTAASSIVVSPGQ
ncbi:MAG: SLBB domain-containing protein [Planctomycetes bacterium]|uniref:SLBB domain-containing protein n=1 Tax=Candidatus Wunengus sp. YC65 TaxID=3367701 RepID=UPI001D5CDB72|nr:SLBB domain-containing protein [Planctomycetota bacterium]